MPSEVGRIFLLCVLPVCTIVNSYIFPPGKYFFELDQKSVLPGYPKLVKDVWGIEGPIDAAFTRYNCQGKTYIFKVGTRRVIRTYNRILIC